MNVYVNNLNTPAYSIPERSGNFYETIVGTSANRSFIPRFSAKSDIYKLPKIGNNYGRNVDNYHRILLTLGNPHFISNIKIFRYSNYPVFQLCIGSGLIYEVIGKPVIHFLIAENTEHNPFVTESRRYFVSKEFSSSGRFKYIYKAVNEKVLMEDSDSSIVITDNILELMFDEVKLPRFNNLDDRIAFQENIAEIIIEPEEEEETGTVESHPIYPAPGWSILRASLIDNTTSPI